MTLRRIVAALALAAMLLPLPAGLAWAGGEEHQVTKEHKQTKETKEHPGHKAAGEAGKEGHAKAEGENPIFPWALDLGIWTLAVFLLLVFVLGKFAWRPMLEGLNRREQSIRAAVDEAKLAREETRRVQAEFQAKMDEAFAQIPKLMDEARRNAEQLRDE